MNGRIAPSMRTPAGHDASLSDGMLVPPGGRGMQRASVRPVIDATDSACATTIGVQRE
jgi:hypothetical protein